MEQLPGENCDPNEFYSHDDMETLCYIKYFIIICCVITFIHTPFLALMPFFKERLKVNSRKIISMIMLSDFGCEFIMCWATLRGFPEDEVLCYWVTQMHIITRTWSQLW